jgi:DNA-binding SARP family transcriptional activator/DNA-binding beta-propeller fold protein YncE
VSVSTLTREPRPRVAVRRTERYGRRTNALEFRVLGPLQVASNGSFLSLGGAKQRVVLALLLLNANKVVSIDRIIDELWNGSPPDSAANIVHGYVSHLRKELEPGRQRGEHELLVSRPPGYLLRVGEDELDAERFSRLAADGRRLLAHGDVSAASTSLRGALALWRGPALADLAYDDFARLDVDRLEELRLAALEDRIDADLALGREAALVPELRELTAAHPLRERMRAQLMAALYRSGRQAEALEVFRDTRRVLDEELGIEPGPALRELERAILQHDPALGAPPPPPLRAVPRVRRRWLLLAGAVAVATAATGVAATLGGSNTPPTVTVYPHSVAVIDPGRNRVVDDILVGGYPTAVTADSSFVYVANAGDATVSRIDPKTRKVFDTGALSRATDLAARDGHLWAANGGVPGHVAIPPGTISDLDFGSGAIRTLRVGPSLNGDEEQTTLAIDPDGFPLWVGNENSATVTEVDPSFDRILRTMHGIAPGGLAPVSANGTDVVWASDPGHDLVLRIDGDAGTVTARIHVPGAPTRLAADGRTVWAVSAASRTVTRIDASSGNPVATIRLPIRPKRIVTAGGAVWVSGYRWSNHHTASKGGLVLRIDPSSNRIVARIPVGDVAADGMVFSRGLLWVAIAPSA